MRVCSASLGPNVHNSNAVADLYAEVLGVVCQSRFGMVRRKFSAEIAELKNKRDLSPQEYMHSIIAILLGMQFYRIKVRALSFSLLHLARPYDLLQTNSVDELEQGVGFLNELAGYFLEIKDRDFVQIKHNLAGLLVEILVPVANVRRLLCCRHFKFGSICSKWPTPKLTCLL